MCRTLTEAEMQMLALDPEAFAFEPWVSLAHPEAPEDVDFPFFSAVQQPETARIFA